MSINDRIIIAGWYRVYTQHFIVRNSPYEFVLSLNLQGIPNRLPKIVLALSAEHASQSGNSGSRIKLDVDMVVLMDEEDGLISATNCDSFG